MTKVVLNLLLVAVFLIIAFRWVGLAPAQASDTSTSRWYERYQQVMTKHRQQRQQRRTHLIKRVPLKLKTMPFERSDTTSYSKTEINNSDSYSKVEIKSAGSQSSSCSIQYSNINGQVTETKTGDCDSTSITSE